MQRRHNLIEQQGSELQERHFQREMTEKLRQQRETIYTSPITNNHEHVVTSQSARWRNPTYQNWQKNLQSNARVDSRFVSPARAASWSSYYSKSPQPIHERFFTYRTLQEKTRSNVANGDFNQQLSKSEVGANSVGLTKQNVVLKSSLQNSEMEKSLTPMKEQVGPVTVSQPVMSTWQRPDFNRVLPSSQRNATPLTSQPVQRNQSSVHVSSQLISDQIASPGDNVNPTPQSQFRISSSNQSEEGNQSIVLPKNESSQLFAQSAKSQVNQFSVKVAGSVFQRNNDSPPSVDSRDESNRKSQTQRRGGGGDGPETQKKPQKKEKLFYFPIKRDTLIRLLPSNLQEKYRSLRETRNINSTYEASIDKAKVKSKFLEDMNVQQNVAQKMDSSTNISKYKYSIEQIKTGNNSITEYFDLLPQSPPKSPYQSQEAIKSNNNTIVP